MALQARLVICNCTWPNLPLWLKKDRLETYASIPAICSDTKKIRFRINNTSEIVEAAKSHPEIQNILNEVCKHLVVTLSTMISFTDPEIIILGNQPKQFYKLLIPALKKKLLKKVKWTCYKWPYNRSWNQRQFTESAALLMNSVFKQPWYLSLDAYIKTAQLNLFTGTAALFIFFAATTRAIIVTSYFWNISDYLFNLYRFWSFFHFCLSMLLRLFNRRHSSLTYLSHHAPFLPVLHHPLMK